MSEWNDGYWVEGLDRVNRVLYDLNIHVQDHPAIDRVELNNEVDDISSAIYQLYRKLAEASDEA